MVVVLIILAVKTEKAYQAWLVRIFQYHRWQQIDVLGKNRFFFVRLAPWRETQLA